MKSPRLSVTRRLGEVINFPAEGGGTGSRAEALCLHWARTETGAGGQQGQVGSNMLAWTDTEDRVCVDAAVPRILLSLCPSPGLWRGLYQRPVPWPPGSCCGSQWCHISACSLGLLGNPVHILPYLNFLSFLLPCCPTRLPYQVHRSCQSIQCAQCLLWHRSLNPPPCNSPGPKLGSPQP